MGGHYGRIAGSINPEKASHGCDEARFRYIHHSCLILRKYEAHQRKHEVRYGAQRQAF